jgi:ATP-dependent exoDNAse (exonuclease V) beta subunit
VIRECIYRASSRQIKSDSAAALLTVHSSKGLEFEVVFIVGMAEGVFPDYRSQGKPTEMAEEKRNAFVAVNVGRPHFSPNARASLGWALGNVKCPLRLT